MTPPKPNNKERLTFTTKETLEILDKAKYTRLYLPILLAVTTGMRRGEILGLRWKVIDFDNNRLSIRQVMGETRTYGVEFKSPKTEKSTRSITLPITTINALKQHKVDQAKLIFKLGRD